MTTLNNDYECCVEYILLTDNLIYAVCALPNRFRPLSLAAPPRRIWPCPASPSPMKKKPSLSIPASKGFSNKLNISKHFHIVVFAAPSWQQSSVHTSLVRLPKATIQRDPHGTY